MIRSRKLGVCTWTFGDLPLADIAGRLARLGFDGVELMGDLSLYGASEAKGILQDHGLAPFSLTPANVDLARPDRDTRREALDYYFRLLSFAAELGQPLVSCHGLVGRVRPVATLAEERAWLVEGVGQIADRAAGYGLKVVFEVLNRYEAHLVNTGVEAQALVEDVDRPNVGILLDAYHMNIEEPDPAETITQVGDRLWLYHAADSNRGGLGRGHTDFRAQLAALDSIGYPGPIILECTAPGPDPFAPIKGADSRSWLETYLRESREWLLTEQRN